MTSRYLGQPTSFARDPEGRKIEFQQFLHSVPPITS